jgi:hypothetical protein
VQEPVKYENGQHKKKLSVGLQQLSKVEGDNRELKTETEGFVYILLQVQQQSLQSQSLQQHQQQMKFSDSIIKMVENLKFAR